MHVSGKGRRAVADLAVAFAVGLFLVILNCAINYIDSIHEFFVSYSGFVATDLIINFLFFWLTVLLLLAFLRWRRATRKSQEMENIVSSISPDTLLVVSPDRGISMCNTSVKRTFGYSPEEVLGKQTDLLYCDRRRNSETQPREVYEALQRDGFHVGSATGVSKGGKRFPLEIIAGDLSGRSGAVLLLRDVTERREAEKKRLELETRIRQRQKLESLGILAGGIAHDFNNLLTVIMGNTELAGMHAAADLTIQKYVEQITAASRQASGLCNQMLAYSGKGRFVIRTLDLSQVVQDTVKVLEISVANRATLNLKLGETVPHIDGDEVQIQQVIMNLVINAADASENGDGTISIATGVRECDEGYLAGCAIEEQLAAGKYVYLDVADTGCGMDEETKSRIFDPFFTTKKAGRGLGLASVLGIIRGHRGALRVDSTPGDGTLFSVLFPYERGQ